MVEIGLSDLPKSGGAMVPPASPAPTDLLMECSSLTALHTYVASHVALSDCSLNLQSTLWLTPRLVDVILN